MTTYKTIPALPLASVASAADLLEISQAGISRSTTVGQLAAVVATGALNPRSFGAVGDGVTDDRAALQAAIDACAAAGGGTIDCSGGRWLIDSANLNVKKGVFLVGSWGNFGRPGANVGDFSAVKSSFIVNPSFTIRLVDHDCGIQGMVILCKGLAVPTDLRTAVDIAAAFAGTAVTVGDGVAKANDAWLSQLFIAGFATGISSNFNDRSHIQYIQGDNTNGIYMTRSFDMQHLSHVHFWPFVTSGFPPTAYAVSGAVDNGSGLVRLTVAANPLRTGDRITVTGVGGVTGATGPFVATVVNPTTIDLQGSTFGGAYTTGGSVYLSPWYRSGVGINFDGSVDWGQMSECFTYSYATGIRIKDSNHCTLMNSGCDASAAVGDTSTVGIYITGTSGATTLIGCKTSAQGSNLKIDAAAAAEANVTLTGHRSWGPVTYLFEFLRGSVTITNCSVSSGGVIRMGNLAGITNFIGGDLTGATFSYESTTAFRPSFVGVRGSPQTFDLVKNGVSGASQLVRYEGYNTTPTNADSLFKSYYLTQSDGTQIEIARESYRLVNVTAGVTLTGSIFWATMRSGVLTSILQLDFNALTPLVHNVISLGAPTAKWSNLQLANSSVSAIGSAATAGAGARAHVADSTVVAAGNFGNIVAGTGTNSVPVYSDGTNWRIG